VWWSLLHELFDTVKETGGYFRPSTFWCGNSASALGIHEEQHLVVHSSRAERSLEAGRDLSFPSALLLLHRQQQALCAHPLLVPPVFVLLICCCSQAPKKNGCGPQVETTAVCGTESDGKGIAAESDGKGIAAAAAAAAADLGYQHAHAGSEQG